MLEKYTVYLFCKALNIGRACTVESTHLHNAQELALSMYPGYELYQG